MMRQVVVVFLILGLVSGCAGDDGDEAPSSNGVPPELVDACERWCGVTEVFESNTPCASDTEIREGVLSERGSASSTSAPPRATSPTSACMDDCINAAPDRTCWRAVAASSDCLARSTWFCDAGGDWSSNDRCDDFEALCGG